MEKKKKKILLGILIFILIVCELGKVSKILE